MDIPKDQRDLITCETICQSLEVINLNKKIESIIYIKKKIES